MGWCAKPLKVTIMPENQNPQKENSPASNGEKGFPTEPILQNDLLETLQRVQADFENFRKRTIKEMALHEKKGKASAFKEILPFLDSFENAIRHTQGEQKKGMEKLFQQLSQIMERNHIHAIETTQKKFDPHYHECLSKEKKLEKQDGMVLEEFQKGYLFEKDVLRPAKVKINDYHLIQDGGEKHE